MRERIGTTAHRIERRGVDLEQNDPGPGWSYWRVLLTTPSGYKLALEGARE